VCLLTFKIKSFEAKEDTYKAFKALLAKDGLQLGDKFNEFMENFIRIYGDGNGTSTLDQFVDNEEMIVTPAFFDSDEVWTKYITSDKINDETRQKIIWKCQTLGARSQKFLDYGTVNVRSL